MTRHQRWLALGIAVPGIVICIVAVFGFFARFRANELAHGRPFFQEHYLALGHAYSQAFAAGFFLCFFLTLAGLAVAAGFDARLRSGRHRVGPPRQAAGRRRSAAGSAS